MGRSDTVRLSIVIRTSFPALFEAARRNPIYANSLIRLFQDENCWDSEKSLVIESENENFNDSLEYLKQEAGLFSSSSSEEDATTTTTTTNTSPASSEEKEAQNRILLDRLEILLKTTGDWTVSRYGDKTWEKWTIDEYTSQLNCLWNKSVLIVCSSLHEMTRWGYDRTGVNAVSFGFDLDALKRGFVLATAIAENEHGLSSSSNPAPSSSEGSSVKTSGSETEAGSAAEAGSKSEAGNAAEGESGSRKASSSGSFRIELATVQSTG